MKKPFLLTLILAALLTASAASAGDYKIVVNSSSPLDSITKDKLSDIFLKKLTRWDNGHAIAPVDQAERNSVRDQFSRMVLKKEVAWIEGYWQKMIFSGRATPPAKLASDSEVLDFVRANPDAIGYVTDAATLGPSVKTLTVKD